MTATDTYLGLRAFCDELARSGVRHAVTSPGSRSTPLVLSLAREPGLTAHSVIDERAAGFLALGAGRAGDGPAVLACTSGTAAANYAPAVIEAHEARVPLLVLTADRPPELRDNGAGQTIDQVKLFGRAARWFLEIDDAPATPRRLRWLRQLACRAVLIARQAGGPVHLNWALREPLVLDAQLPAAEPGGGGRPGGAPWLTVAGPGALVGARRPVVVAGAPGPAVPPPRGGDPGPAGPPARRSPAADASHPQASPLRDRGTVPVLADPLSGRRRGAGAIAHYDAILRDPATAAALRPDAVLRVGDLPVSKPLRQWLADLPRDVPQYAVTSALDLKDPDAVVSHLLDPADADAAAAAPPADADGASPTTPPGRAAPSGEVDAGAADPEPGWLDAWRRADAALPAARATWADGLTEPLVATTAYAALDAEDTLVVAASMPIRDLETFAPVRAAPPRVLANRGANGIDGTVATALGVAAAGSGRTLLWLGDVALAHDLGGLAAARRLGADLAILVVDNGGGGIFDFLPVAAAGPEVREHVTTPTGLAVADAARLAGARHTLVTDAAALADALAAALAGGLAIVEVRTDRRANVDLHRAIWAAVSRELHR